MNNWFILSFILHRKAQLLLLQSQEEDQLLADDQLEEYEMQVEDRMMQMAAVRESMFTVAADNIKNAQARYKKDYDKKSCQIKVTIDTVVCNLYS